MTRFHQRLVQCPVCLNEETITIWDVIQASEDPDLRERLLRKSLQTFECRICGTGTPLAEPMLYEDPTHRLRIESRPDLTTPAALRERLAELQNWPEQPGWQQRLTASTNDLIEKIHLREPGLDDRAMALVKLAVINNPSEGEAVHELYFVALTGEELVFMAGMASGEWYQLYLPLAAYRNAVEILGDQLQATADGWQLIDRAYAQAVLDGYRTTD